jgi:hypothetical protein
MAICLTYLALRAVTVDQGTGELLLAADQPQPVRFELVADGAALVQLLPLGDEHTEGSL